MRKKLKKFSSGDIVRSYYSNGWYGKVVMYIPRYLDGHEVIVVAETICSDKGVPHRKPYRKRLHQDWLAKAELPLNYFRLKERGW